MYNKVLKDSECQSASVANDPKSCLAPVMVSPYEVDAAINKLNLGRIQPCP